MRVCNSSVGLASCALLSLGPWSGAFASESCSSLKDAAWLAGTWLAQDGKRQVSETWQRLSDATFEGRGEAMRDGRVVDGESLRLVQMADRVYYIAKVRHNKLPVAFELTQCSSQRLVFENAAHDFPRRIEYVAATDDEMSVHVSDGDKKGFTLKFRRQPGAKS